MSITVEQFANAVETLLDGTINNSVTSLDVLDGSTFPTANFRIKIEDEILWCSSRSGDTLTVVRGYESTAAASHADGVAVNHTFTVGSLQSVRRRLLADMAIIDPTDSMSADDDDFDDETFSGYTSVERTSWNATITERNHRLSILIPGGTNNAQHYGYLKAKVPSGGNWIQAGMQLVGAGGNYPIIGIGFSNNATYGAGRQVTFNFSPHENRFFLREVQNWDTQTGSEVGSAGLQPYHAGILHMRIQWNSSNNYTCWVSCDTISWALVFSAQSVGSVGTPSHAGIITTNWGATGAFIHSFTYLRYNW